ncbi:MAG: CoA pyrophosphatase [Alphaproteobacteria bacterium]
MTRLAAATRGIGPCRDDGPHRPGGSRMPAAVLVPLVDRPDGFTVLMTRRTEHLAHHGGQICFPGGRVEPEDPDAVATALRETEEEIGLSPSLVDLIGTLDDYETITGFIVTPVVGVVRPPFVLTPDPFEVADVFEVPLTFVLDPANHRRLPPPIPYDGPPRTTYAMPYGNYHIWGATAGMLVNLFRILTA